MKSIAGYTFAFLLLTLPVRCFALAGESTGETDPTVLQAERTLRAAEARPLDDKAMQLYRRATSEAEQGLSRNPESPAANFVYFAAKGRILLADGLTKNLFTLKQLEKDHLDKAMELDPKYGNAIAAKGGIYLDLPVLLGGDPKEGLKLLKRANLLNPGGPGTRISLAKALARNGQLDEAQKQVRIAAHYACIQGRRKALDDAVALSEDLGLTLARADTK